MGSEDLNSCPHICIAALYPLNHLLSPRKFLIIFTLHIIFGFSQTSLTNMVYYSLCSELYIMHSWEEGRKQSILFGRGGTRLDTILVGSREYEECFNKHGGGGEVLMTEKMKDGKKLANGSYSHLLKQSTSLECKMIGAAFSTWVTIIMENFLVIKMMQCLFAKDCMKLNAMGFCNHVSTHL